MDLNIISLVQKNGQNLSVQQAMNEVGAMLDDCYRRWYIALAGLPVWGEKIDREVLRFVTVCRDVALGNLYWRYVCLDSSWHAYNSAPALYPTWGSPFAN